MQRVFQNILYEIVVITLFVNVDPLIFELTTFISIKQCLNS